MQKDGNNEKDDGDYKARIIVQGCNQRDVYDQIVVDEVVQNAIDASIGDPAAKSIRITVLSGGEIEVMSSTLFPIKFIDGDVSIALAFGRLRLLLLLLLDLRAVLLSTLGILFMHN